MLPGKLFPLTSPNGHCVVDALLTYNLWTYRVILHCMLVNSSMCFNTSLLSLFLTELHKAVKEIKESTKTTHKTHKHMEAKLKKGVQSLINSPPLPLPLPWPLHCVQLITLYNWSFLIEKTEKASILQHQLDQQKKVCRHVLSVALAVSS